MTVITRGTPEYDTARAEAIGDGKAYDGSDRPQQRELLARERDVMVRVLRKHVKDCVEFFNAPDPEELSPTNTIFQQHNRYEAMCDALILAEVLDVINPRED